MGEIGLIVMTFFAFIGWALFFGMYLKYREIAPFRVFKVPIGYRFAIIPLAGTDDTEFEPDSTTQERPHIQ